MVSKKLGLARRKLIFPLALIAIFALFLAAAAPQLRAYQAGLQFEDVEFFIEVNSTDGDAGVQLFLDGEQWRHLMMFNPDGEKLLDVMTSESLTIQGLTEFFFESAEPSFDEVSLEEFLARFPVGEYTFVGETVDGERIEGSATFTHVIPAGPVIISPEEGETVEADDVEIEWEPVTSPAGVEIVSYEVIVESDDVTSEFRVLLPPTATSVEVPEEVFDPEVTEYSFEILAKEASGNQTITESEFEIVFEDEDDEDQDEDEDDENDEDEDEGSKDADEGDDSYDGPSFNGRVSSITESSVRLTRGIGFIIDDNTVIRGNPVVGSEVEVQFQISMGRFLARVIEVTTSASQASAGNADDIDLSDLGPDVDNRWFPLEPYTLYIYEGQEDDEGEIINTRVEIRVLEDTEEVAGVDVRVALVEEYEDGELLERTLDFYAQGSDGTVYYMGEDVDDFEDGQLTGHGGQWRAGQGNALAGVFMLSNIKVGDVFEQERAPGVAEDISEVVEVGVNVNVPAGSYSGCFKTEDYDPIGDSSEFKYYCSGVGLVREEAEDEQLNLISVSTFDADEIDEDVIEAIGGLDSDDEEQGEEGEEEDIIGVVSSLSATQLVYEDGTTFEINDDTVFEVSVRVGMRVEIEAMRLGGRLIAVEIDRP